MRDRHKEDLMRLQRRDERRLRRVEDDDDEDLRIVVRGRAEEEEEYSPEPESSPPKKRRLDDDDAELLEMRRKALESLMKRTDEQLLRRESHDRKIVEAGSDESDSDSDTDSSVSDPVETSQDNEPTFIVTMDGIDDNYFRGAAKQPVPEEKPRQKQVNQKPLELKSLSRRKTESLAESLASSDAELELHADIDFDSNFDEVPREKPRKKVHKVEVEMAEKPTMKVAAMKRSPILPPSSGDNSQPVAAVKPIQASSKSSKSGSAAKLAASYAAKLSEIKARNAKKAAKKTSVDESVEEKPQEEPKDEVKEAPVKKAPTTKVTKVAKVAPPPATIKSAPAVIENKSVSAAKRKPITAPSPERSSVTGVSKLNYNTAASSTFPSSQYKWRAPRPAPSTFTSNSQYKWKAGNKIVY